MGLTLNGRKVLDRTLLRAQEFILDADEDSSLTADTDDQLDLRLGGNDVFVFKTSELDISGVNIVNCGDIALDSISDDDNTGINIAMMDASATALTIQEAANAYLTFDTSNGTENIILGKKLTGGAVEIEGSAFDINGGTIDAITSLTVGTDGSGADVYFYSATAGDHLFWDSSEELLTITGTNGQTALNVADGNVIVADTLYLFDAGGESLSSDGTDLTIASGALINLTATSDVIIPVNIGLVFGDGAEKIESNNTDFTINSGGELNLTATSDVVIPVNVGLHLGDGAEKLESNNTDLTINSGVDINLTATADINVPANVGMTFGDDGEKIEGDGTDLTIASSGLLNLSATSGIATNGPITITPGAAGTLLDFELETEWVSGTLIRADFGGATTLNNDTIVVGLDFNSNVSLTTDKDLTGYQVKLPAFTQSAANTTTIMGFDLPTAGALVQDTAAGTLTWKGINIQMPNITQTTGTVTSTGIAITGGTVASGTSYALITDANAGRVGIGTTEPGSLLDVRGAAGTAGILTLATDELTVVDGDILGQIDFQAPLEDSGTDAILVGASIWAEADNTFAADNNATELVFATAASEVAAEKVRITSDGKVGIGTAVPSHKLHTMDSVAAGGVRIVSENTDATGYVEIYAKNDAGNVSDFGIFGSNYSNAALRDVAYVYTGAAVPFIFRIGGAERVRIEAAGNVGIGTANPGQILDVNQGSGNMIADGYDTHSERRFKKNIVELTTSDYATIFDQLDTLKLFCYRLKHDHKERPHLGILADDPATPSILKGASDKYESLSLGDIIMFLAAAVKGLNDRVKTLEGGI